MLRFSNDANKLTEMRAPASVVDFGRKNLVDGEVREPGREEDDGQGAQDGGEGEILRCRKLHVASQRRDSLASGVFSA